MGWLFYVRKSGKRIKSWLRRWGIISRTEFYTLSPVCNALSGLTDLVEYNHNGIEKQEYLPVSGNKCACSESMVLVKARDWRCPLVIWVKKQTEGSGHDVKS